MLQWILSNYAYNLGSADSKEIIVSVAMTALVAMAILSQRTQIL